MGAKRPGFHPGPGPHLGKTWPRPRPGGRCPCSKEGAARETGLRVAPLSSAGETCRIAPSFLPSFLPLSGPAPESPESSKRPGGQGGGEGAGRGRSGCERRVLPGPATCGAGKSTRFLARRRWQRWAIGAGRPLLSAAHPPLSRTGAGALGCRGRGGAVAGLARGS